MSSSASPVQEPPPSARRTTSRTRHAPTSRRRLLLDRAATSAVTAGGLTIIASILGILLFIMVEVVPLWGGASVRTLDPLGVGSGRTVALLVDEQRERIALVDDQGQIIVLDGHDASELMRRALDPTPGASAEIVAARALPGESAFVALDSDGGVLVAPVEFVTSFDGDTRRIDARLPPPTRIAFDEPLASDPPFAARLGSDGSAIAAVLSSDGTLLVRRRSVEENEITGEVAERVDRFTLDAPDGVERLLFDESRRHLFASTARGVLWWSIHRDGLVGPRVAQTGDDPVTALTLLIGGRSLVAGHRSGELSVWFPLGAGDNARLEAVRRFDGRGAAVRAIVPSWRDKGFAALDANGELGLYYSTSERTLWHGPSGVGGDAALTFAPKANGLLAAGDGRLVRFEVDNPHPEVGLGAMFGKIWYEGRDGPEYIWQSSGGSDQFEPKLSLVPLIVGTLKGTVYSLILAVPLAVFGAMYTSQFTHPSFRNVVKPSVEIMAALPSVVLGFMAGLWLAPRMERILPALIVLSVALPVTVILTGLGWRAVPRRIRERTRAGSEVGLYALTAVLATWGAIVVGPWIEHGLFGGDLPLWLLESLGLAYDQRNAVVVGLAMGFAVIPIIYSVAEDAFSNVPHNLVSGSLALGASRWQTVTRVVLPTASPGIFSAIMIGFGRAVGETMIVLMATGNTPIMDWNPFNGFRTLSANIAVEIPEAPHGGTLYRTLFLAALLLFTFTFAINTLAEFVRQRLRRRYAQL